MDVFKEFWNRAVSNKQRIDRDFVHSIISNKMLSFDKLKTKMCVVEMTNPETGEKKFAHNGRLNHSVVYNEYKKNYYALEKICRELFIEYFGIVFDDEYMVADSGIEIEKFFNDNIGLLENFLDNVLEYDSEYKCYSIKRESSKFSVPLAFCEEKNRWIGTLMGHDYKFDDKNREFLDEIEDKSYDENGHFECCLERDFDGYPNLLDDWVNTFVIIMVSYYSIHKENFCDVFPNFDVNDYMKDYISYSNSFKGFDEKKDDDVKTMNVLIDKHIKTFDDIKILMDDYAMYLRSVGYDLYKDYEFKNVREFFKLLEDKKPDGVKFKDIMEFQNREIKTCIAGCLVSSFED